MPSSALMVTAFSSPDLGSTICKGQKKGGRGGSEGLVNELKCENEAGAYGVVLRNGGRGLESEG
eukprot:364988-Chlamydomonas_euryale.AAC.41